MPLLHFVNGHAAFAQRLKDYPQIPKAYFAVMVTSSVCQATDSFMLGVATSGRISFDTYHKVAIVDWAITFSSLVFFFLWRLWDIHLAIASYLFFFGCYVVCIPIENQIMARKGVSPVKYKVQNTNLDYWTTLFVTVVVGLVAGVAYSVE